MNEQTNAAPPDLMTQQEAAAIFRVSRRTIHGWAITGRLGRVLRTPTNRIRLYRDEVLRVFEELSTPAK